MKAAIGIDVGGTHIKTGVIDEDGTIVQSRAFPTEASRGKTNMIRNIIDQIEMYKGWAAAKGVRLSGVGIGTAGYVDAEGIVAGATANIPGWGGTWMQKEVGEIVNLPVAVDNDANVSAIGEAWVGAGAAWDTFLCITLGTGVGGCLIYGKSPYRGREGFAGGYGHQVIVVDGHPCTCGFQGCWEQYASVSALKRLALEHSLPEGAHSPEWLFDRAKAGADDALRIIDRYTAYIAIGLSNLIHIFNPPAIVVGGAVSAQGNFLFDRIEWHVSRQVMPVYLRQTVPIVPALLGNNAGIVGAAKLSLSAVE